MKFKLTLRSTGGFNMSDTEHLKLIEYYKWNIRRTEQVFTTLDKGWEVYCERFSVTHEDLRQALNLAMTAQINWSLGG
jgi:hypothetical protein